MGFHLMFVLITVLSISIVFTMPAAALLSGGVLGGLLSCPNTCGPDGTNPPIPNVQVDLVCGNGSAIQVIKTVVTDSAGFYRYVIGTSDTVLYDPAKCYLTLPSSTASCNFNLPTGAIKIPIVVFTTIDTVAGSLRVLVPGPMPCAPS